MTQGPLWIPLLQHEVPQAYSFCYSIIVIIPILQMSIPRFGESLLSGQIQIISGEYENVRVHGGRCRRSWAVTVPSLSLAYLQWLGSSSQFCRLKSLSQYLQRPTGSVSSLIKPTPHTCHEFIQFGWRLRDSGRAPGTLHPCWPLTPHHFPFLDFLSQQQTDLFPPSMVLSLCLPFVTSGLAFHFERVFYLFLP